jgi:hypothetical protein
MSETPRANTSTPILSTVQARQGVVSGRVVTVLGCSLVLAIVGIVLAFSLIA